MRRIERRYLDSNAAFSEEAKREKERARTYRNENTKLKRQMLKLVELDDVKNRSIEEMERRLEGLEWRLHQDQDYQMVTYKTGDGVTVTRVPHLVLLLCLGVSVYVVSRA